MLTHLAFLKELAAHGRFAVIYVMRQLLLLLVCFPVHQVPSEKGFILKGKNLLPLGATSFLSEETPF